VRQVRARNRTGALQLHTVCRAAHSRARLLAGRPTSAQQVPCAGLGQPHLSLPLPPPPLAAPRRLLGGSLAALPARQAANSQGPIQMRTNGSLSPTSSLPNCSRSCPHSHFHSLSFLSAIGFPFRLRLIRSPLPSSPILRRHERTSQISFQGELAARRHTSDSRLPARPLLFPVGRLSLPVGRKCNRRLQVAECSSQTTTHRCNQRHQSAAIVTLRSLSPSCSSAGLSRFFSLLLPSTCSSPSPSSSSSSSSTSGKCVLHKLSSKSRKPDPRDDNAATLAPIWPSAMRLLVYVSPVCALLLLLVRRSHAHHLSPSAAYTNSMQYTLYSMQRRARAKLCPIFPLFHFPAFSNQPLPILSSGGSSATDTRPPSLNQIE